MIIKSNNQGQIALIILMVSAVVMTIGLSLSKKSVVETKITTDEELLKQAFNVAESGIDYYLGTGGLSFTAGDGKSKALIEANSVGGGTNIVNMGDLILANNQSYTWLVGHNADGTINMASYFSGNELELCFDADFTGSLKVDFFYYQNPNYQVKRLGYDVINSRINGYELVSNPIADCSGVSGMKSIILTVPLGGNVPLLLAVKPIADSTKIAVVGNDVFPSQGEEIRSSGTAGDITGTTNAKVNRNVKVINKYFVPAFMLDAITSGGQVSTN